MLIGVVAAVGAIIALGLLGWAAWNVSQRAAGRRKAVEPFTPDPRNDTSVIVRGWRRAELDQILAAFAEMNELSGAWFALAEKPDGVFDVRFPGDIEPDNFVSLVDYLNAPDGFDARPDVGAVGRVTLTRSYPVPEPVLIGRRALVYVPTEATEFELVHAEVPGFGVYRVGFTDVAWQSVRDARKPAVIADL